MKENDHPHPSPGWSKPETEVRGARCEGAGMARQQQRCKHRRENPHRIGKYRFFAAATPRRARATSTFLNISTTFEQKWSGVRKWPGQKSLPEKSAAVMLARSSCAAALRGAALGGVALRGAARSAAPVFGVAHPRAFASMPGCGPWSKNGLYLTREDAR